MSDNYDGPQLAQKILRQQAEIEQLRQMVRDAATALNEEERENERLYDAIFRHRERVWGEGKV